MYVECKLEELVVGGVDSFGVWFVVFKYLFWFVSLWVDFVLLVKVYEVMVSDVFEVVEVGCEEEDGDDEDYDFGGFLLEI